MIKYKIIVYGISQLAFIHIVLQKLQKLFYTHRHEFKIFVKNVVPYLK